MLSSIEMDTTLHMDGKGCLDIHINYLFWCMILHDINKIHNGLQFLYFNSIILTKMFLGMFTWIVS